MKNLKKALAIAFSFFAFALAGCDLVNAPAHTNFDNNHITPVEGQEGYYTDEALAFCAEIRGSYKSNRPFTLDAENENLRVWDNMYLYEYDYFQMIASNTADIFYSVNEEDLEYVTVEDKFAQATVQEGKSGIYKVTFDLSTKLFDLEYKSEITTPVYEKMDGCDVYSLSLEFTPMTVNPDNSEEFMIANYPVQVGELISFFNHGKVHLSNYKVILDEAVQGKYATAMEDGDKRLNFAVGGLYNLYVNPVTYAVRVELTNPDDADYELYVFTSDGATQLTAPNPDIPYIFTHQVTVKKNAGMPIFAGGGYVMFDLNVNESEYIDKYEDFIEAGTYALEINLKTFTITVTYLPQ